jgi:hypothetical protein
MSAVASVASSAAMSVGELAGGKVATLVVALAVLSAHLLADELAATTESS